MQREEKERIQAKLHRAADAQRKAFSGNVYHEGIAQGLDNAAGLIGRIPCDGEEKADFRERKTGRWIEERLNTTSGGSYGVRRCSECKSYYQDVGYGWNYCPNCGSYMEEEKNG